MTILFLLALYTNKKGIEYPCFLTTARNLGTNSLIAFRNGFKSVPQSFHTVFFFVFDGSSELYGSSALPWYTFSFTRSRNKWANGFTSAEEGSHSTHLTKRRLKVFSRKYCTKIDRCDGELSWSNILVYLNVYNNFLHLL